MLKRIIKFLTMLHHYRYERWIALKGWKSIYIKGREYYYKRDVNYVVTLEDALADEIDSLIQQETKR